MNIGRTRAKRAAIAGAALIGVVALIAAACGGGTSNKDKTATAAAGGGAKTPAAAATTAATKAASTPAATKAATTPAATAATTAAAGATQPSGTTAGVKVADSALGKILVDDRGFALYTFTNDVAGSGKSAAEGLTAAWPPLSLDAAPSAVAGATGEWTVFIRADGKKQVAYKGMPLYFFVNDKAPGETNGDKVGNVWFVAVP